MRGFIKSGLIQIVLIFFTPGFFAQENVYEDLFRKHTKTIYNDTMFERVVWHKKVSNLVIESLTHGYFVTLLVIPESPYNYKSQTYPLHYFFNDYKSAFEKFAWLDRFLREKGILKVRISGSRIVSEEILQGKD